MAEGADLDRNVGEVADGGAVWDDGKDGNATALVALLGTRTKALLPKRLYFAGDKAGREIDEGSGREALPYLERGMALAKEEEEWGRQLDFQSRAAFVHYSLGASSKALEHYKRALGVAREVGDPLAEARLLGRIGAIRADEGEVEEAVAVTKAALELASEHGDPGLLGEQQIMLAFCPRRSGTEGPGRRLLPAGDRHVYGKWQRTAG